jgi:hypothetical protein
MATARISIDVNNRVLVGLLGPVALSLGLGNLPGDTDAADLVAQIVERVDRLKQNQVGALLALHEERNGTREARRAYQLHDQQFRVLNIDDEVVWSSEWRVAGEDGLQKLAAVNHLEELKQRGTDFGMHVERYQRCRWVNLTTQAHDEPHNYDGGTPDGD